MTLCLSLLFLVSSAAPKPATGNTCTTGGNACSASGSPYTLRPPAGGHGAPVPDAGMMSKVSRFRWDVPNVVSTVDVPGITNAMGVPVKMQAVTVKGKMDDTIRYIYDSMEKQGLAINPELQKANILTGFDPDAEISFSAVFQENAPGYITVVLGTANLGLAKKPQGDNFIPLFSGGKGALRANTEGVDTLVYTVPDGDESKVRSFYTDVMVKTGWKADPKEPLTFQKADERISIQVKQLKTEVGVYAELRRRAAQQ